MKNTPVHFNYNPDLLRIIPDTSSKLIEIGCSSGALAHALKLKKPDINWIGVEIDFEYAELASRYCNEIYCSDIESWGESYFNQFKDRDCWIFGDVLEHLKDPWSVIGKIRAVIPEYGSIVACIPNASHWSLVVKFATGSIGYQDEGLLDRTHLRWFSRSTIRQLFEFNGFRIVEDFDRIFYEPDREKFLPLIGQIAALSNFDREQAINDAIPLQYLIRAVPG
jgi:hypothetical protein